MTERDGAIYINGERLIEPYVDPSLRGHENGSWPRVAPGHYFVLGDNRANSSDSRYFGPFRASRLLARPLFRYWPLDRTGQLN